MKKTLKKLLICILIFFIINNFFISNITFASDDAFGDWLADLLGTVVGLLTWPIRIVALGCGWAIDSLTKNVAYSQGAIDANGNIVDGTFLNNGMITPFDIFFNKIALLDVNFFNILNDGSIISNIRNSIAGWYYVMRMIAASILLCVLIYVGIRMAISTIASDKAAYKKMLVDWVCSLALIFVLQYIILFTFAVNEAFIKALSGINDGKALSDAMVNIKEVAMGVSVNSIAATIVFCMLVAQTLGLLISYFNRMLKIAFLIIIAPLITLTYSIDKMGDGKAQALGTWLKEFIYTVLLQTFHCIIYMAFVSMALSIFTQTSASEENNLAGAVLAVLCVKFTKEGEKILGKIFKFSESTSDSSLAAGMAVSAMALGSAKNIGKGARSAVNGIKSLNLGGQARNVATTAIAMKAALFGGKDADGNKVEINSKEEAVDYANSRMEEMSANRAEKKNKKKYGVDNKNSNYEEEVNNKANQIMNDTGVTARLAKAQARSQIAAKHRTEGKESKQRAFDKKHKVIAGARGFASKVGTAGTIFKESETAKFLKDMGQASIAAGIGTFTGSASYGATGDAFKSVALGMASYKGTQEYLKNSTGTLVDASQKLCGGVLGAKNGTQVENEMKTTKAMAPILGEGYQSQIEELLKFVEKAFDTGSEEAKDAKSTIRSTVSKNLKEHPEMSMEQMMESVKSKLGERELLKGATTKNGQSFDAYMESKDFTSGVSGIAQFQARKELYDTMEKGTSLGLSSDALTRMASKGFKENSDSASEYQTATEIVANIAAEDGTALDKSAIDKLAEDRTEFELGVLRKELAEERLKIEKQINADAEAGKDTSELEEKSEKLYSSLSELDAHEKEVINGKLKEYETQYAEAVKRAEAEATEEAQKKFDTEVAKMRKEVEEYKSRIEKDFGKERGVGIYSNEFNETLKTLKTSEESDE